MIRVDKLKGIIAEKGLSQSNIALKLGITPKTFYEKMAKGIFRSDEIEKMIALLDIYNPMDIFFANDGTYQATKEKQAG